MEPEDFCSICLSRYHPTCQEWIRVLQNMLMVGVAQLAEHRVVAPAVAGSSPVVHPKVFKG
jgi:hypothetical protein